jgi:hypothetical protein
MSELADVYIWKGRWRLPKDFESKREFKILLAKNDFVLITDEHYSKKNGRHVDVCTYAKNGDIGKKMHCKVGNNFGSSLVKCLRQITLEEWVNSKSCCKNS